MSRPATILCAVLLLGLTPGTMHSQERGRSETPDVSDLNEDGQARRLPPLPQGMTLDIIRQGDAVFHGKGGCVTCHGPDAGGMPAAGSGITAGLSYLPSEWDPIDSLIRVGIPEPLTRSPIAMPPGGAGSNLSAEEIRQVAAYVWAISQVRDEPWPGGHRTHSSSRTQ
ncbi:MAG TPA: cytochrome c [Gemmatimonadales bacterium]